MTASTEIIEGETTWRPDALPATPRQAITLFGTDDPAAVVQRATEASVALMSVVKQQHLSVTMRTGGKSSEYLLVEAWTLLGSMVGVFPVTVWTKPLTLDGKPYGWEARVEARTRDGSIVGTAESMCTRDEITTKRDGTKLRRWGDADEHALRSMAQTRATSKALATPLRFIATLAGFSGTTAEEMQGRTEDDAPVAAGEWQKGEIVKGCPEPNCDGKLVVRDGKRGQFAGCNNYPRCKHIEDVPTRQPETVSPPAAPEDDPETAAMRRYARDTIAEIDPAAVNTVLAAFGVEVRTRQDGKRVITGLGRVLAAELPSLNRSLDAAKAKPAETALFGGTTPAVATAAPQPNITIETAPEPEVMHRGDVDPNDIPF